MQPWELQAIRRAHLLHLQLESAVKRTESSNVAALREVDFMSADSPYMQQLVKLYREDMALAGLLDSSDLLLHAEGPGAIDHSPRLRAVNWLCSNAEKHIKSLLSSLLPMTKKTNRIAIQDLDLRLCGLAPGSLYAGFALAATTLDSKEAGFSFEDDELLGSMRKAMHSLPVVPQYVDSDRLNPEIMEALPDPALRDAVLVAAYELAPTGSRGIHTVEISSPRAAESASRQPHALGQRERLVLRDALRQKPMMRQSRSGSFIGVLRAIDLDTMRISVRGISSEIAALRGCLNEQAVQQARYYLDQQVRITGEYECGQDGQPRMMQVQFIELAQGELT
jgi:hypothetical protein